MKVIFELFHNEGHDFTGLISNTVLNCAHHQQQLYMSDDFNVELLLMWDHEISYSYLRMEYQIDSIRHFVAFKLPDQITSQFVPDFRSFAKILFALDENDSDVDYKVELYDEPENIELQYSDDNLFLIIGNTAYSISITNPNIKQIIRDMYLCEIDMISLEHHNYDLKCLTFKSFIQSVSVDD